MAPFPSPIAEKISLAAQLIRSKQQVVALTGAGISTPSGIPDFRSPGSGLWTKYQPMEVASLTAFRYNPESFYKWLRPLAQDMFQAQPNPAHVALADLQTNNHVGSVITQNIDNLHQKAGSEDVLEVHGSFETLSCINCHKQYTTTQDIISDLIHKGRVPRCPQCDEALKPDVVLFEEQLPVKVWKQAQQASQKCQLMLILGSSLTVQPVSHLPFEAVTSGADLVIINKSETYLDDRAQVLIHDDVAIILPEIARMVLHD